MKWFRRALKGISLTAAMFVFQACYGTMDDYYSESRVTFRVVDIESGEPLAGIRVEEQEIRPSDSVEVRGGRYVGDYTETDGTVHLWTTAALARYTFVDKDSVFVPFDTIVKVSDYYYDTVEIALRRVNQ